METALKVLLVVLTAPLWARPLRLILAEIVRVARLPEEDAPRLASARSLESRAVPVTRPLRVVFQSDADAWVRGEGRISNPRWETGRRPRRSERPDGTPTGFGLRRSRPAARNFGAGRWAGGFGRR